MKVWTCLLQASCLLLLLQSCMQRSPGALELAEQMLAIEQQQASSSSLSPTERKRLKELQGELIDLSKKIQQPILERSRFASRKQAAALIFLKHGMYQDAQQYFTEAIEYAGDNAILFYYRALANALLMKNASSATQRQTYLAQAERDYQRSLEIKADYTDALFGLAVLRLFEQQDYSEAANLLDRYIAERNITKQAAQSRGKVKNLREAQRRAKELGAAAGSKDIRALFMRAQAAYGLGDYQAAAGFYDWIHAIAIDENLRSNAERLKDQVLAQMQFRQNN